MRKQQFCDNETVDFVGVLLNDINKVDLDRTRKWLFSSAEARAKKLWDQLFRLLGMIVKLLLRVFIVTLTLAIGIILFGIVVKDLISSPAPILHSLPDLGGS